MTTILQIRNKGTLTLPIELRRKYGLDEGDILTLIELGDGSFLLSQGLSQVAQLGDRIANLVEQAGLSEADLLSALDEERKTYYQDHYLDDETVSG